MLRFVTPTSPVVDSVGKKARMAMMLMATENAISQLLIQYGVLEDSILENHVREVNAADLENEGPMRPLHETFNESTKTSIHCRLKVVMSRCKECQEMSNNRVTVCCSCEKEGTSERVYFLGMDQI